MAVDILPASIPFDASHHFSESLFPYLQSLIGDYRREEMYPQHEQALERATVARQGKLVGSHQWLKEPVEAWRESIGAMGLEGPHVNARLGFVDADNATRNTDSDRSIDWPLGSAKPAKFSRVPDATIGSSLIGTRHVRTYQSRNERFRPKKVLMLGSGMVAGPAVDEICNRTDVELVVGVCIRSFCLDKMRLILGR
jgi:alpha-aminoadipic semialdehyde synthase